jgi:hypothetical protein
MQIGGRCWTLIELPGPQLRPPWSGQKPGPGRLFQEFRTYHGVCGSYSNKPGRTIRIAYDLRVIAEPLEPNGTARRDIISSNANYHHGSGHGWPRRELQYLVLNGHSKAFPPKATE